jgi:lysophospholipase L1-like esterase
MKAAKWIGISLLVFIGMELLTRAVFPEAVYRQENFGFYPAGAGDLLPSRCFQDRGYTLLPFEIKTNRLGLRSNREYTRQKPPGVFRIAALGDSFTYGLWVNNQDTWPAQLETLLNREQFRCEVFNTGIVGFTLADEYQLLKEKAIHYDPDLVLVAFYSNDIMDFIPEMRAIFARKKAQGHLSVKEKIRFVLRKTFHHSALYCLLLEWKYKLSSPPKNKPAEAALILNDDTRPDPKLRNACLAEYLRYLDKTIRLTQERNVRLAFVFFPDYRSFEKKTGQS